MVPPKRAVKMNLSQFLNDDTFGSSWQEDDIDLDKINIPIENVSASTIPLDQFKSHNNNFYNNNNNTFRNRRSSFNNNQRSNIHLDPALSDDGFFPSNNTNFNDNFNYNRENTSHNNEFPVPNHPPFRAIINNIPFDITPEGVQAWVEDGLQKPNSVDFVELPKTFSEPIRLKGIAFITFKERSDLIKALTFNSTRLNERTVYVSVAAPRRNETFSNNNLDWGSARGSKFLDPSRDDAQNRDFDSMDWSHARGANFNENRINNINFTTPNNNNDRIRRKSIELNWSNARNQNNNTTSTNDNIDLNWSNARGSNYNPQETTTTQPDNIALVSNDNDEDWSGLVGTKYQESRPHREKIQKEWIKAVGQNQEEARRRRAEIESIPIEKPKIKPTILRRPKQIDDNLDWTQARGSNFDKFNTKQKINDKKEKIINNRKEKVHDEKNKVQNQNKKEKINVEKDKQEEEINDINDNKAIEPEFDWSTAKGSQFEKLQLNLQKNKEKIKNDMKNSQFNNNRRSNKFNKDKNFSRNNNYKKKFSTDEKIDSKDENSINEHDNVDVVQETETKEKEISSEETKNQELENSENSQHKFKKNNFRNYPNNTNNKYKQNNRFSYSKDQNFRQNNNNNNYNGKRNPRFDNFDFAAARNAPIDKSKFKNQRRFNNRNKPNSTTDENSTSQKQINLENVSQEIKKIDNNS